jgi:S1-C subfamily serine protease
MKQCHQCGQLLAEEITTCPTCGSDVAEGIQSIDNYRILSVLHEGYSSVVCHAIDEDTRKEVAIRIFTPQSGVDEKIAARLKQELEILKELPEDYFIKHLAIKQSATGLWYRVSEWIDNIHWGQILTSDRLKDYRTVFHLFYRMASILEGLHQIGHFIPHLILNDIIVFETEGEDLAVKIDYKVSRFLDPRLDRPGAMLKNLLSCHPDTINQRPLNARSDIWSLGKIFVEILSGDLSGTIDYVKTIDQLAIPTKARMLLKVMLAEDRDMRPDSMAQVVRAVSQITDKEIVTAQKKGPDGDIRGLKRWIRFASILLAILVLLGGFAWYYFANNKAPEKVTLSDYANRYAGSVAFVMVDYRLMAGQRSVYRNRTEGTAFLVDSSGYLLTNRHVACPWLEDQNMLQVVAGLKRFGRSTRLDYRAFLWFEGQNAFKRLPAPARSIDLEDTYDIHLAYQVGGRKRLTIAGVARPPVNTWQVIKAPLRDDFAILKIDPVPEGIVVLPLDDQMDPLKIPKLTPVMTLGFPLGSRTQTDTINVSVSTGHVRRTFKNMFQVDTSIYQGNSGGPVIDPRGRVVGIASSVYVDLAKAPIPVVTLLSDIGLVLPINKAAVFLAELKAGQSKWNGFLDLAMDEKLEEIHTAAGNGDWEKAQQLADDAFGESADPALAMAAGLMHYCRNDAETAKNLFSRALSMNKENDLARLMIYLIDDTAGQADKSSSRQALMTLDWRSPSEFFGYLVKMMNGDVEPANAVAMGDSDRETSWLHYIAGLMKAGKNRMREAAHHFRTAATTAVASDHWPYFMAMAKLKHMVQNHAATMTDSAEKATYQVKAAAFAQAARERWADKVKANERLATRRVKLIQDSVSPAEKRAIAEKMLAADKHNANLLVQLAYYNAMDDHPEPSLTYTRRLIKRSGRESPGRLAAGLLEPLILNRLGRPEEAKNRLEAFYHRTRDPWYREISACLLGRITEQALSEKAGERPAYLVTGHTALGLWAEGNDQAKQALRHYKEALGSYRDDRIEYQFAKERIKRLQAETVH